MYVYLFSSILRELFYEHRVSGIDDSTKKYLQVLDRTRTQAVVYEQKVLRMSEEVVRSIGFFMDYSLNDEWKDIPDLVKDLEGASASWQLLIEMHLSIVVELNLKKNEVEARVGLQSLIERYIGDSARLKEIAAENSQEAREIREGARQLADLTFGISTNLAT